MGSLCLSIMSIGHPSKFEFCITHLFDGILGLNKAFTVKCIS
jgi:hypothetical protein